MKKIALVLAGCGVFDGSEIHESVCTMLALQAAGLVYQCMAANVNQTTVINHLTQQPMTETRNVLVESARIARGDIIDIATANADDYCAAIYPGGMGAVLNHSDFAQKKEQMTIQPVVLKFAKAMAAAHKPQGFICIAPVLISKIYGEGVEHTIGCDQATAEKITAMGGKHIASQVHLAVVDKKHKVVSTPAYMLAKNIGEVQQSTTALVEAIKQLVTS